MVAAALQVLFIAGFLALLASGAAHAVAFGRLRQHMKQERPGEYAALGLDAATLLAGPAYGGREMQDFVYRRGYAKHPDAVARSLGRRLHLAVLGMAASLLTLIALALFQGLAA